MPRNIEIKARIHHLEEFKKLAESISDGKEKILIQRDTFFNVEKGRLKLRIEHDYAELIYYERSDQSGPKLSDYCKYKTKEPEKLKEVLSRSNGVRGVVEKTRSLFMCGQTRIHVDDVKGLGQFMELEVVLRDDQTIDEGQVIANDLMKNLGVLESDLLTIAYMDMLEQKNAS